MGLFPLLFGQYASVAVLIPHSDLRTSVYYASVLVEQITDLKVLS